MVSYSATYSPDDNKLRLYASSRLDAETYRRVKAGGFIWAPKQGLWVAPAWAPGREDLLLELAGVISDDDTSLVARAEDRAERFDGYAERRKTDANAAREAADAISERFYGGQPILVGHHSEKKARKDQERMHGAMTRAVKLWDTSGYWSARAAGAIQAAKYKEQPSVRARRIRGLESDRRKEEKEKKAATDAVLVWEKIKSLGNDPVQQLKAARAYTGNTMDGSLRLIIRDENGSMWWSAYDVLQPDETRYKDCPAWTPDEVADRAISIKSRTIQWCDRWIAHIDNRLLYERAMLAEAGGLVTDRFKIEVGGRVLVSGGKAWGLVTKINRGAGGEIVSVSCNGRRGLTVGIEAVRDYREATTEDVAAVRQATSVPPLANYPGEGIAEITQEQWTRIHRDYKGMRVVDATETVGRHRVRYAMGAFTGQKGDNARHTYGPVFISDAKVVQPPTVEASPQPDKLPPLIPAVVPNAPAPPRPEPDPAEAAFRAMKQAAKAGPVPVIAVPQLFPTPPVLADRMARLANIMPGHRILEPSAGTGHLLAAIDRARGYVTDHEPPCDIVAVEINRDLMRSLPDRLYGRGVAADFLACEPEGGDFAIGRFDRIVMNPPFKDGADIRHILLAKALLTHL